MIVSKATWIIAKELFQRLSAAGLATGPASAGAQAMEHSACGGFLLLLIFGSYLLLYFA